VKNIPAITNNENPVFTGGSRQGASKNSFPMKSAITHRIGSSFKLTVSPILANFYSCFCSVLLRFHERKVIFRGTLRDRAGILLSSKLPSKTEPR
jgi:hypothetical protein